MSTPSRLGSRRWLIVLVIVVAATAFVVWRFSIGFGYPGTVTSPEVVGLVESITSDADGTAHVVLADGRTLTIERSDRSLGGFGDLLFVGNQPDRWYLAGHAGAEPGCYTIAASRAYSDADAVVFAFEQWPGVGVRLPKAPGFDDSRLATRDFEGRMRYSAIGPISICANAEGQISESG